MADLVPPVLGVNVTFTAQFAPGMRVTPFVQLLFGPMLKSTLFCPVMLMGPVMVRGIIPRLVKVIVTGELVVPTSWPGKAMLFGDKVAVAKAKGLNFVSA